MKLSEILSKPTIQNAFLLGMIYGWPIFSTDNKYILAYSAYNPGGGSVSKEILIKSKKTKEIYFNLHKDKLIDFLKVKDIIFLNSELREKFKFSEELQPGVSILIDFDFKIPENSNSEVFIYGLIEKYLIDLDESIKKFFLIGIMDSRGSIDFTARYISIDIAPKEKPEIVKRKINKFNDLIGNYNFNPRTLQPNSTEKNAQARINLFYFLGHYGLFIPYKIDYYQIFKKSKNTYYKNFFFLLDKDFENLILRHSYASERNLNINELAIKLKKEGLSEEEKKLIVEEYRNKELTTDSDDEIIYSSQNIKETAKFNSNYKCEYDTNHISFTAKSNTQNYVEGHHLIPFSKRNEFKISIDVVENIVSLCPNCHRKIHLAIDNEKLHLIEQLYEQKIVSLTKLGINISKEELLEFYQVKEYPVYDSSSELLAVAETKAKYQKK